MLIDEKFISDNCLVASEDRFLKKYNNIYITDEQATILFNYGIDVNSYNNVEELLFDVEEFLNDSTTDLDDLEWVSQTLSEYNYYNNTNK